MCIPNRAVTLITVLTQRWRQRGGEPYRITPPPQPPSYPDRTHRSFEIARGTHPMVVFPLVQSITPEFIPSRNSREFLLGASLSAVSLVWENFAMAIAFSTM